MTTTSDGYPWQDGDILDAADLNVAFLGAYNNVGRNLIHNPLFNIAQRGTGPWTVNSYTLDRWLMSTILDTVSYTQGQHTDATRAAIGDEAARVFLFNTFTGNAGATAGNWIQQGVEGVRRLSGKTVTVSFWAAAGATLKLGVNLFQIFGTGGSPSAFTPALTTGASVTLTTQGARYSVTIPMPSSAGKTFGTNLDDYTILRIGYSSGANSNQSIGNIGVQSGSVWIWGVQLEIGSVATPLEKPDPRYDLSNCQRFYSIVDVYLVGYNVTGALIGTLGAFPVQMRGIPTITISNTSGSGNITGAGVVAASYSPRGAYIYGPVAATGTGTIEAVLTASADL